MMEFKQSMLWDELHRKCRLSEDEMGYLDACTDDWTVEYQIDFRTEQTIYKLRVPMDGCHHATDVELTATYVGDLDAMWALIAYLNHVNELELKDCGWGADYDE